jgi:hypothetical protein
MYWARPYDGEEEEDEVETRKKTRWWRQVSMGKRKEKIEWSGVEEQGRPYDVLGPAHTFSM